MCILLSSLSSTFRLLLCILLTFIVSCSCNPSLTTTSTALQIGATSMSKQHTTRPITTGTSVLGIVYDGGVLLAADTLLSYGSMVKSFNTPRLYSIEDRILLGASGEYSDLQEIVNSVKALALEASTTSSMESIYVDRKLPAKNLWNYLRAVMYQKRSKMNPYWNDVAVAGWDEQTNKPFLGTIDRLGTTLQENLVATGFGSYLAMPLMREKWRPDLSEGEARALLEDCMKVLFYRDCRASARIQLAKCTVDGCIVSEPYELDHSNGWNAPSMIRASGDLDGDGGW
jgi:20S proteasome subunit beta 7